MRFDRKSVLLLAALIASPGMTGSGAAQGQTVQEGPKSGEIQVGKPLFVSSATAVCGPLEKKYPFDPATYGKSRGYSPTTSGDSKIVIYTRSLDKDFFRLASALDAMAVKQAKLPPVLVIVIDAKGAQNGGYSVEEVKARREEIRHLAQQNKLEHLSFFLSAPGANGIAPRLGLTGNVTLFAARLDGKEEDGKRALVQWETQRDATKLSEKAVQELVASLEKSGE